MKVSVSALLLLLVAGVKAAAGHGSVTVTQFRVTWIWQKNEKKTTEFEISTKQTSKNGEGPFLVPKKIEFRLPSSKAALFKLSRKENNRVKSFRVNGSNFKVGYNTKGKKVKRVTCPRGRGRFCSRKLSVVEDIVQVNDEVPAGRSLQTEIGRSCDACEDFWESICDSKGILLLCDTRGRLEVRKHRDGFAVMAVDNLCDAVTDVCKDLDKGDGKQICALSFGANDCPTSSPTSAPTSQEDAIIVQDNIAFAGELNSDIFGTFVDTPLYQIPVLSSGLVTGRFEIRNDSGKSANLDITEIEVVQFFNVDTEVENAIPADFAEKFDAAIDLVSSGFVTTGIEGTVSSGDTAADTATGFSGLFVSLNVADFGGSTAENRLFIISDDDFLSQASFDVASVVDGAARRRHRRRRGLQSSKTDTSTAITGAHSADLGLHRRLVVDACSDQISAGAEEGLAALGCDFEINENCVARVQFLSEKGLSSATTGHNAGVSAARLGFNVCLLRVRTQRYQFASSISAFCLHTEFLPALKNGLGSAVAWANTATCWRRFQNLLHLWTLQPREACWSNFIVALQSSVDLRDAEIATVCATAKTQAESCANCVQTSMRF